MDSRWRAALLALWLCLAGLLTGCQASPAPIPVELIDVRDTRQTALTVREILGTYGSGCPLAGQRFSACVSCDGVLTYPPLVLPLRSSDCALSMDALRIDTEAGSVLYVPSTVVSLGDSYSELGTALVPEGAPQAEPIYVNLRVVRSVESDSGFLIQLACSDSTTAVLRMSLDTTHAVSLPAQSVPAPDYWIDLSSLTVWVDAGHVVVKVAGSADLVAYRTPGTWYVVLREDLGSQPDYARVDTAFLNSVQWPITERNPKIPADTLRLQGEDLDVFSLRTLIAANEVAGVRSYRVIRVTFPLPL